MDEGWGQCVFRPGEFCPTRSIGGHKAKGPIGQVINAALGGVTLVEALFPLYWIVVRGRPISDISSGWLEIYVYVGAVLMLLVGGIGIRSSQS